MALQLSLRKGLGGALRSSHSVTSFKSVTGSMRWQSSRAAAGGDVIGIDLGTTNSCVAIMVSGLKRYSLRDC